MAHKTVVGGVMPRDGGGHGNRGGKTPAVGAIDGQPTPAPVETKKQFKSASNSLGISVAALRDAERPKAKARTAVRPKVRTNGTRMVTTTVGPRAKRSLFVSSGCRVLALRAPPNVPAAMPNLL